MDLHMVVCFLIEQRNHMAKMTWHQLMRWKKMDKCHLTFRSLQKASTVLHGVTRKNPIFLGRWAAIKGRWYHENSIQIHKQKQIDQMDSNGFVMIHLSAVHFCDHSLAGEGDCRRRQNQKWRFSDEHTHTRKSRRRVVETCFLSGTSHQLDSKEG